MRAIDLAHDLALALDPVALFTRATGLMPDPWQVQCLRSTKTQLALNCCRQAGKSTVASVLSLHTALYVPEALVLICAPALRQSQELFGKIKRFYTALDGPEVYPVEAESELRLEFAHGARIVVLPGKAATVRGFS